MWMVAANFRQTYSPCRLAWSEGWRPPGAQSTCIKIFTLVLNSQGMKNYAMQYEKVQK